MFGWLTLIVRVAPAHSLASLRPFLARKRCVVSLLRLHKVRRMLQLFLAFAYPCPQRQLIVQLVCLPCGSSRDNLDGSLEALSAICNRGGWARIVAIDTSLRRSHILLRAGPLRSPHAVPVRLAVPVVLVAFGQATAAQLAADRARPLAGRGSASRRRYFVVEQKLAQAVFAEAPSALLVAAREHPARPDLEKCGHILAHGDEPLHGNRKRAAQIGMRRRISTSPGDNKSPTTKHPPKRRGGGTFKCWQK